MYTLEKFDGLALLPEGSEHDVSAGGLIAPTLSEIGGRSFEASNETALQSKRDIVFKALYTGDSEFELNTKLQNLKAKLGKLALLERKMRWIVDEPFGNHTHTIKARMMSFDAIFSGKSPLIIEVTVTFRLMDHAWNGANYTIFRTLNSSTNAADVTLPNPGDATVFDIEIQVWLANMTTQTPLTIYRDSNSEGQHSLDAVCVPESAIAPGYNRYRMLTQLRQSDIIIEDGLSGSPISNYDNFKPTGNNIHRSKHWWAIPPGGAEMHARSFGLGTGETIDVSFIYKEAWL